MSSEKAIVAIETVRKKLEKYVQTKQDEKVKEYLNKLQNTSVTPPLLRATKIDIYVSQLASNSTASYNSVAKALLNKWHEKSQSSKSTTTTNTSASKVKTITNTNQTKQNEKTAVKRKSDHDEPNRQSGSQSTNNDHQTSTNKKRKVLSFSEYLSNKKPVSSTVTSTEKPLADIDAEQVYAQFSANSQSLVANPSDLAANVNKKLKQSDPLVNNRPVLTTNESTKTKGDDFWEVDDDEDEEEVFAPPQPPPPKQQPVKKATPSTSVPSVKATAQVKTEAKTTNPSVNSTVATAKPSHFPPPPPPPPSSQASSSNSNSYIRAKQGRQAIYSGKRTLRTSIPSLQDLCVEKLKENIEDSCHKHWNLLPYDIVKPIIDVATPEQLEHIVSNNPDYIENVEPLWKHFCTITFKDATREECETYYELYLRKRDEQEEKFLQFTESAKRKKEETTEQARQTKTIAFPHKKISSSKAQLTSSNRIFVDLPSSKFRSAAAAKAKSKPTMTPLFKKTMKLYNGKMN